MRININKLINEEVILGIIFFLFLFSTNPVYCQKNKKELNHLYSSIDSAYESCNWERLIEVGKEIEELNKNTTFNKGDSEYLIAALDLKYKMAIAYTWMDRSDLAEIIVLKKFNVNENLFPLHTNYLNYYKTASEAAIKFISNDLNKGEGDFLSPYKEAVTYLSKNNQVYLDATINLISQYIVNEKPKHAISLIFKALFHLQQNKASQKQIAELYYYLYRAYLSDENYALALENSLKSYQILEKANLKTSYLYAKVTTAVGISYFHMQEIYTSKEFFHKSLELNFVFDYKMNSEIALIYDYLSRVYFIRGNGDLAYPYKTMASEYYSRVYGQKHRMTIQTNSTFVPYMKNKSKDVLLVKPILYELLNCENYTYGLWSTTNSFENDSYYIFYAIAASLAYTYDGRTKDALYHIRRALNMELKNSGNKDSSRFSPYYQYLAQLYSLTHQMDSASLYFKKALNLSLIEPIEDIEKIGKQDLEKYKQSPYLIDLFSDIVQCYLTMIEEEKIDNVKEAYLQALDYCQKCEKLSDIYWEKMNNQEDKLYLKKQMNDIYNRAIDISFKLKELFGANSKEYLNRAFVFSQKSKTNVLEEMTFISGLNKSMKLPDNVLKKDFEIRDKIEYWERKISQRTQNTGKKTPDYLELVKELEFNKGTYCDSLFYYLDERDKIIDYYKKKYPQYYDQVYKRKQYSISEIQTYLDNKTVLLDYHINNKSIDVFVISKSNFIAKKVPVKDSLELLIDNYRNALSEYPRKETFMERGYLDFREDGSKLYSYLIESVEDNIKNKEKLIIIADKSLSLLPFETLVPYNTTNSQDLASLDYLIKKYEIVYNYSCNLWINSVLRSNNYKKQADSFLGIAPVFDKKKMNLISSVGNVKKNKSMKANVFSELSELPATALAINEICDITSKKGVASKKYLYEEATKYQFVNSVKNNKYILVATHGKANYQNSYLSGLYFIPDNPKLNENEQYFLYSGETYNLNLSSDLLILYACETGVGKINKGEGVMAISRGFISSGTANIIHSLWNIQDVSTKDLIVNIFELVFARNSYSSSIRQAKLEMINYGIIPFHWAGLILIGN